VLPKAEPAAYTTVIENNKLKIMKKFVEQPNTSGVTVKKEKQTSEPPVKKLKIKFSGIEPQ